MMSARRALNPKTRKYAQVPVPREIQTPANTPRLVKAL
jgi:hypothetical protein